jgi:hypothetical protein
MDSSPLSFALVLFLLSNETHVCKEGDDIMLAPGGRHGFSMPDLAVG